MRDLIFPQFPKLDRSDFAYVNRYEASAAAFGTQNGLRHNDARLVSRRCAKFTPEMLAEGRRAKRYDRHYRVFGCSRWERQNFYKCGRDPLAIFFNARAYLLPEDMPSGLGSGPIKGFPF